MWRFQGPAGRCQRISPWAGVKLEIITPYPKAGRPLSRPFIVIKCSSTHPPTTLSGAEDRDYYLRFTDKETEAGKSRSHLPQGNPVNGRATPIFLSLTPNLPPFPVGQQMLTYSKIPFHLLFSASSATALLQASWVLIWTRVVTSFLIPLPSLFSFTPSSLTSIDPEIRLCPPPT